MCDTTAQVRSVVTGPMLMVRFGTCGALRADVTPGTVLVASMGAVSDARFRGRVGELEYSEGQVSAGVAILLGGIRGREKIRLCGCLALKPFKMISCQT